MAHGDEKGNKSGQTVGTFLFLSLFVLIGIGLVIFGVVLRSRVNEKKGYYQTTVGQVTDMESYYSDDGNTYYPVYSYTVDGQEYTLESSTGYGDPPDIGSHDTVWYNPYAPYDAFVGGDDIGNSLPVIIGIMFIGIAGGMIVSAYIRNARLNRLLFGIFVGAAFMAIPFLFCVVAPEAVGVGVRVFLLLFGLVGAFIVFAGIHDFFRPDKPLIHTGGAAAGATSHAETGNDAAAVDTLYGEPGANGTTGDDMTGTFRDGSDVYGTSGDTPGASYYASQLYEFSDDHKETIDKVTNVVVKEHMVLGQIIGVIAGAGFALCGLVGVISEVSSIMSGGLLVPQLMMMGFNIVFIIVGVVLMVKSIKSMGK